MEIKIIEGNLLDSKTDLILHQCNMKSKMNSGVAKAIREKWPIVFEKYKQLCDSKGQKMGMCQPVKVSDNQRVINMFSQENYGYDGKLYTSYDAVNECFGKIKAYMELKSLKSLSIPYNMCCCRGGANWDVIMALLKANLIKSTTNH
jgi:hypothetical protein